MILSSLSRAALALVVSSALVAQEPPATPLKTGTLIGEIIPPAKTRLTRPVQVVLLDETFADMYDTEALHRLDEYWERFKPAFVESKELFYQISQVAQTEAIEFVLTEMRRDGADLSRLSRLSTPEGKFEFRNVPLGQYKVVGFGSAGANDFVWHGWANLEKPDPVNIQIKTTIP